MTSLPNPDRAGARPVRPELSFPGRRLPNCVRWARPCVTNARENLTRIGNRLTTDPIPLRSSRRRTRDALRSLFLSGTDECCRRRSRSTEVRLSTWLPIWPTRPSTGLRVQACGDCHLLNFGAFATPERRIIFDINDLDETLPAPWEWDVKRLAASFVLACRNNGYSESFARDAAATCVRSYRERMAEFSEMHVLDVWYAHIDMKDLIPTIQDKKTRSRIRKRLRRGARSQRG